MRAVMAEAKVGDDVYGEDPTVRCLEEKGADMAETEAALFVSSGTQSNLLALLSHCKRGDEYIVGQLAHNYRYEGGGAAVLGSIQPQPLNSQADGTLDLNQVQAAIKPDDFHFARTTLLCLENTHNGLALPFDYLKEAAAFAHRQGLKIHLDGARVYNAAVKYKTMLSSITSHFDSVSICLSKGLGAPVGSLLCGDNALIKEARRWRKMVGGGMRQAGIVAAAGIFALEHNIQRLEQDHANGALLAQGLGAIEEIDVDYRSAQTNMVFITMEKKDAAALPGYLREKNILIHGGERVRLVTHLDIPYEAVQEVVMAFKDFFYSR